LTDLNPSAVRQGMASDALASDNAVFLEAVVAAYALMAHADGEIASAERRRLFAMVRDTPAFEVLSRQDVAEEAAVQEANFRLDSEVAQQIAWEKLNPVVGQRRAARVIVGACRELIPADGVAHPAEYRMLSKIKARLGVDDRPQLA
jgi:tellurite resistance protein